MALTSIFIAGVAAIACVAAFAGLNVVRVYWMLGGIAATCIVSILILLILYGIESEGKSEMFKEKPAIVMMAVVKTLSMGVSLLFCAADMAQLVGWLVGELPETGLNNVLTTLGEDIGGYKAIPILVSLVLNIVFNDRLVKKYLDDAKSPYAIVFL